MITWTQVKNKLLSHQESIGHSVDIQISEDAHWLTMAPDHSNRKLRCPTR